MSSLKKMDAALIKAPSVKAALQLPFVKEITIKNYQAVTGRKDGENYFASQVFEFLTVINEKPELQSCDRFSMMAALIKIATMGLSLADGHIDLIKYGNVLKASANYKGHREQMRKMENIESVGEGVVVLKGEEFVWDKANNKVIKHVANEESVELKLENIRYAYVRVTFTDKTFADVVVSNEELKKAKSKSKNKSETSAWNEWTSEMCKKVAVHRAHKTYYRRPEVSPELELGDYAKDDEEETLDIKHTEEPTVAEAKPEPPVETPPATTPRVVGSKDSLDDFLSKK